MNKSTEVAHTTKLRIGLALFLFATYFYGVFSVSAFSDDYPALVDPAEIANHAARDGRPLNGLGFFLFFGVAHSVENLWILRLVGLLGLVLLSDVVNKRLLSVSSSNWSVFASTIAFTSISFQFFTHWATAFMFPWAAALSLIGLGFWTKESKVSKIVGIALLTCSLAIYPLLSFFSFSVVFVEWYFGNSKFSNYVAKIKSTILYMGTGGTLLLIYIVLYRIFNTSGLGDDHGGLVSLSELPRKIFWFVSRPVALGFWPFSLTSPTLPQLAITGLPILALLSIFALRKTNFNLINTGKFFIALALAIVLALAPLLVVSQNQIDFRLIGAVKWLIETLLIGGLFAFFGTFFATRRKAIAGFLAGVLALLAFINVNQIFNTNFKTGYLQEIDFFKKSISDCSVTQLEIGVLILSRTKAWPSKPLVGVLSQTTDLASEWVPVNSMRLYLSSQGQEDVPVTGESKVPKTFKGCVVRLDDFPSQ
jgi:hypothetical protein